MRLRVISRLCNPARARAPRARRDHPRDAPVPAAALRALPVAATWFERRKGGSRWRAHPPGARGARPDLREVRPGALHAPRPAADRTSPTNSRSCRTTCRRSRAPRPAPSSRRAYGRPVTRGVRGVRRDAAGRSLDRAGARREAALGRGRRGQGPAPDVREQIERDLEVLLRVRRAWPSATGARATGCAPSRWCTSTRRPSSTSST